MEIPVENVFGSTVTNSPKIKITSGEILADGSVLDVVEIGGKLQLYHWDGEREDVGSLIKCNNTIYQLPNLHPSFREAIKFPSGRAEFGCASKLFADAQSVFLDKGFSVEAAGWGSLFALISWVCEVAASLPTLLVYGTDLRAAEVFFSTLSCLCRRPLLVAQLSRALPFSLRPTLLTMMAELSAKDRGFWSAVNVRGVWVPAARGRMEMFASARALFVQDAEQLRVWGPEVWRLSLIAEQVSPVSDLELARISDQFQNQFFSYRLHYLLNMSTNTSTQNGTGKFNNCQPGQLLAIVQDDELMRKISPLIEKQQSDFLESQKRDPHRAIVEVLWPRAHTTNDFPVAELVEKVNALLDSRGASIDFDELTLGWRLRQLGLERKRNSKGKFLRLDPDIRYQVHQLARRFGLNPSKVESCRDCQEII